MNIIIIIIISEKCGCKGDTVRVLSLENKMKSLSSNWDGWEPWLSI